ncbi:MAG: type II and III secretion system protein family protein [Planctomycetes bacterium]|nr:type II and III secretion system protein family protein [Planctomycetota bacterium]MBI3835564.1 type II and III secretion system protein family protein [Planctomycetota bacterium]
MTTYKLPLFNCQLPIVNCQIAGKARSPGNPQLEIGNRLGRATRTALIGILLFMPPLAAGQTKDAPKKEFKASVLDLSGSSQRITVPINRNATVETTVEIARADVIAKNIADAQIISPTRLLITGEHFGNTTVVLQGADNREYTFEVNVELDIGPLNDGLKSIDPQSTAKAMSIRGNIVLMGTASSAERARRMIELAELFIPPPAQNQTPTRIQNNLDIAGEQQVLLRCVVAEVSRIASRQLGINGFLAGENFRDGFIVNQLGGFNPINIGAGPAANVRQNVPFLTGPNGIPISPASTASIGFPRVQMQLFLQAMADNSLLQVLAEPNLVAISGETATFLAGGQFPVPVPQGLQQITIQWKEFGVRLNFTPIVRGHKRIRLRVSPEVSQLDPTNGVQVQGSFVPGLNTRSTETTVELGSGQTIAIAGLLSEEARALASRIPGAGDIPVLGSLFRSQNFRRAQTELVVLVTPEIVAPLDAHQMVKLPGGDVVDPNDFELYGLGLTEAIPPDWFKKRGPRGPLAVPPPAGLQSQPEETSLHGPWGQARDEEAR